MSLLLAPYTNAMRLGQGFNSYTQQICIDDAVSVDPDRAENVLTNDGSTMRIVAEASGKPSVWNRMKEVCDPEPVTRPATQAVRAVTAAEEPVVSSSMEAAPDQAVLAPAEVVADAPIDDSVGSSADAVADISAAAATDSTPDDPVAPLETDETEPKTQELEEAVHGEEKEEGAAEAAVSDTSSTVMIDDKAAEEAIDGVPESTPVDASKVTSTSPPKERTRSSSVGRKEQSQVNAVPKKAGPAKYQVGEIPTRPAKQDLVETPPSKPAAPKPLSDIEIEQVRLDKIEKFEMMKQEKSRMAEQREYERKLVQEQRDYQRKLDLEAREDERARRLENQKEQQEIRREQRNFDKARREASQKAINDAVMKNKEALTLDQLFKIKAQNQFADHFDGIVRSKEEYSYDPSGSRGPSQVVTYSSRFIDKLSDVTDDMCISGALSIKASKIGGSGRGSFVDSDKFKQSDLNFYISVKVVNQTINFKDALAFNKMRSVAIDSKDFNKVYGDSFISGFVEGGEFNAIVSMKVHNKAKLTDIQAEAKVALTAGPLDVTAQANVAIARSNLEVNTETTIQVSWSGGGHIKPREQPWNIETIMQAAARFPELVAACPQRTHAILTKYESIRSFVNLRPAEFTPIQYENAQIYTNVLMDAFMSFKSLYKKIGDQVDRIQNKTLVFEAYPPENESGELVQIYSPAEDKALLSLRQALASPISDDLKAAARRAAALTAAADTTQFEASLRGLSDARKQIRRQLLYIVNEVSLIEGDPKAATDEDHEEPFQAPLLFETRLPVMKIPEALKPKSDALSGRRMMAKPQSVDEFDQEQDKVREAMKDSPPLYDPNMNLSSDEKSSMDAVSEKQPGVGKSLQITPAAPETQSDKGTFFNNLDFLYKEWQVESITIGMTKKGCVGSVEVVYENGLILKKGMKSSDLRYKTIDEFHKSERIVSAAVEVGSAAVKAYSPAMENDSANTKVAPTSSSTDSRVLSVCLFTNRGRRLLGQAISNEVVANEKGKVIKDGVKYENVQKVYSDCVFGTGSFKGFFGRVDTDRINGGILRLGMIWGDKMPAEIELAGTDASGTSASTTTVADPAPFYDFDSVSTIDAIDDFRRQRDAALAEAKEAQKKAEEDVRAAKSKADEEVKAAKGKAADEARKDGLATIQFDKTQLVRSERHSVTYRGDTLHVKPSDKPFLTFDNGSSFCYMPDGDLVVYAADGRSVRWSMNKFVPASDGVKELIFHGNNDGNLVAWKNGGAVWATETITCRNGTLVLSSEKPFLEIFDDHGVRKCHYPNC